MKKRELELGGVPALLFGEASERLFLSVHGKMGRKEEAEPFALTATELGWQVLSVDLPEHGARRDSGKLDPWHVLPELQKVYDQAANQWRSISLYGVSIGAWFSLLALAERKVDRCLLVSPVLDMEKLIETMLGWAGATPQQLRQQRRIPTSFGETLDWDYYCFARENPVRWRKDTRMLYAGKDHLTPRSTAEDFCRRFGWALTVMEEGEHWFHTGEQLSVLRRWEREQLESFSGTGVEKV